MLRILVVLAFIATALQPASAEMSREAAMVIFEQAMLVPGTAAYCRKYGLVDDRIIAVIESWNKRHWVLMEQAVKTVKQTGMSPSEREEYDKAMYRKVQDAVEGSPNKFSYCTQFRDDVAAGKYDLR